MENLAACVEVPGVDEVHIGLNDLHLEMGCSFMFEPLATGYVEKMAEIIRKSGIPFGIGGLARVGEGEISSEILLSEHVRLGSSSAILSRTFHRQAGSVEEIQTLGAWTRCT
jgi:2-keto-3-deoxy-L-rhamnonate aldolase RhmA